MTTFADQLVAHPQTEILAGIYQQMETPGNGAPGVTVRGLRSTSMLRALPEIVAQLEAGADKARVDVAKGGFLQTAEALDRPEWLYLLAEDEYQITADPAQRAEGLMRVAATSTASNATIATGKFIVRYGSGFGQKVYENVEPFAPNLGGTTDVKMRAQVAGSTGNIGNNATLALVTAYPGLSVTNPPIGSTATWITLRGTDIEVSASIASRCRARWGTRSLMSSRDGWIEFVRQAFSARALSCPITRVFVDDTNPDGPGSVRLYLARAGSTATADDVLIAADWLLPKWRAGGGPLTVLAAPVLSLTVGGTIKGPSNEGQALSQKDASLDALASTYPIEGATVYAERVRTSIMTGVTGAKNVVIDLADTPIPPGYIVAFLAGTWTVTP